MSLCRNVLVMLLLIGLAGCGDEPLAPRSVSRLGDQTMTVTARVYDEFEREIESADPIPVTLTGSDRVVHKTIPRAGASAVFERLPLESYIISAQKDGYFPFETVAGAREGTSIWSPDIRFYPHPSPDFRIDSITVAPDPLHTRNIIITLTTAQRAPSSYAWWAFLFFSNSPSIDPSALRYNYSTGTYSPGGGNTITVSVSKYYLPAPASSGAPLYVTARLLTPASKVRYDDAIHQYRCSDMETNTSVVASFIP